MTQVETLIIGAGVIGSSVAMHLAQKGMSRIRVIDFDLEGSLSSSELNAGGVRATWVQPINIEMSQKSIDYFAQIQDQVGYRDCGYLWLYSPDRIDAALKAREKQLAKGWPVEAWDIPELQRKVPFIDKVDSIAAALFSPRDGLINPNLLKNHFRAVARSLGVEFEDRVWMQSVEFSNPADGPITVTGEKFESVMSYETKLETMSSVSKNLGRFPVKYSAKRIINCAGPWAARVAEMMGYQCSSYPLRRQVSIFDCRGVDLTPYGMIVDTSGVYFHPEATNGLAGFANANEPRGINFQYDGESFFTENIWPALYERSSYFERLKHLTGWAGLYDVSPDESAIMGQVDYGGVKFNQNVYEAHSFSGHGVMHSYAAGLLLAEKILYGKYETLDAEMLSGVRFERGQSVHESLVI